MDKKLLTIEEHDELMDALIAEGRAVVERATSAGHVTMSGIACPACGFRMMDTPEADQTDPEGRKFRKIGCFRCGNSIWRRTP